MAKSKGFFGLRSGSTKNFTFSELNGQQITKERVYKVKNPRTMQQMRQRMVMATVSAAYGYLKEICDHSFEGFGVGAPSMAEFMRVNLDLLKPEAQNDSAKVCFNAYGDKGMNPVEVKVAQGSIDVLGDINLVNSGKLIYSKDQDAGSFNIATAEDYYNAIGLQPGDMLTFLLSKVYKMEPIGNAETYAPEPLAILRVRCDKSGPISTIDEAFSVETNGVDNISVKFRTDELSPGMEVSILQDATMGCVIISRQSNGKWLRSNAFMKTIDFVDDDEVYSTTVARQLASYPVERDLILNGSGLKNDDNSPALPRPTLSVSPTTVTITTEDGTAQPPTLSGAPEGAKITYSIQNAQVATIDASSGVATAKANGSTKVTIHVGATETSSIASVQYTLTVTGQNYDAGGEENE